MANALQVLDVDVQLMILHVLSQISSKSLLNVALSSKSLYRLSRSFIYRVIHFTFNRARRDINGRLIKQLLADDDLSTNIREIHILWAPSAKLQHGEGSKEDLELLGQALPKLTGLKTFVWDAQYPILSWLLKALQIQHPQCSLYIRHPAGQDSAQTLQRLYGSPCLFSLDVALDAGQYQAAKELRKILASAQNLRDLTIASAFNSPHITAYQEQEACEPLHLRSLELYGRFFDDMKFPVVWAVLERLSVDHPSFLLTSNLDFSRLKLLKLQTNIHSQSPLLLRHALKMCKKLEVLDLTGFIDSVRADESLWRDVGKTLIKLRLHEEDVFIMEHGRDVLSPTDMERVAKHCPNLRSFGLDLVCDGQEWPHTMLNCIADEFWFLVHLELNILVANPQHNHPTSPKATLYSVPEIWRYLWQQILRVRIRRDHLITTPRLRSLDLIAGSYRPVSDPSSLNRQLDQQRFTFDLCDRDDEACLGIANVKCTEVEALLSKLSSASPIWNHQQELIMKVANERARKGPHIEMPSVTDSEKVRPSPYWDKLDEERFPYR